MSKTVRITYYGMDGEGRTTKEAKADASAKLEAFVKESSSPKFLSDGGQTLCIWRDRFGWNYAFVRNGKLEGTHFRPGETFEQVRDDAAMHLAQIVFDPDTLLTIDDVPAYVTRESDRRELVGYSAWQRAARYASDVLHLGDGCGQGSVHGWACDHQGEFLGKLSNGSPINQAA